MKILILGGSGFVGTRLTELLLEAQCDVKIGDLIQSEKYPALWEKCDVRNQEDLRKTCSGREIILNLAAAHRDDVRPISLYKETNVDGAQNVCDIATELGIKHIIFTSSVAIYGFPTYEYDEDSPKQPFNEYGVTKLAAEKIYNQWQQSSSDNILTVIRPTVIFGEGNRGNVYNLFRQLASGKFLMIGPGNNKKSMAYVGNVAAFLKWNLLNNRESYSVFNYVDKPDLDMNELLDLVETILLGHHKSFLRIPYWIGVCGGYFFDFIAFLSGKQFPISSIRIKKFCAQTIFGSDKMQKSGFVPPYKIQDALKQVIKFEFCKK